MIGDYNIDLSPISKGLDIRAARIEAERKRQQEEEVKKLVGQSLTTLREGSPIRMLFEKDPQHGAFIAKTLGIPLTQMDDLEQLSKNVFTLAGIAKNDPQGTVAMAQKLRDDRANLGLDTTQYDSFLKTAQEDMPKSIRALDVMNQALNSDLIEKSRLDERKAALSERNLALQEKELNWRMNQPAGGSSVESIQTWNQFQSLGGDKTEQGQQFGRAHGFLPSWSQDAGNRGDIKSREVAVASTNKLIDDFYSKLQPINMGIANFDKGIELIDKGAKSGVIDNLVPSFTAASQELDNIRLRLGADILSSGIFGAQVSDRDVKNAFSMAAPPLDEKELKRWMIEKKQAQEKVRGIYEGAIKYLAQGHTVADLADLQAKERDKKKETTPAAPQGRKVYNPASGKVEVQ